MIMCPLLPQIKRVCWEAQDCTGWVLPAAKPPPEMKPVLSQRKERVEVFEVPYPKSETTYPWSSHSCIAPLGCRCYQIGWEFCGDRPFSLTSLSLVISRVCNWPLSGFATGPAFALLISSLVQRQCFSLSGAVASRLVYVAVSVPALFPQLCYSEITGPGEHFPALWWLK